MFCRKWTLYAQMSLRRIYGLHNHNSKSQKTEKKFLPKKKKKKKSAVQIQQKLVCIHQQNIHAQKHSRKIIVPAHDLQARSGKFAEPYQCNCW